MERIAGLGALVSVDTYKPQVAEAAIAAGAVLVNDVSGLRELGLADLCARTGAGLVVTHTRVEPKGTLLDPGRYDDVAADSRLPARADGRRARARGRREQMLLDPGPDFAKTPAQTVAVLRALERCTSSAARCCWRSRTRTSSARSPAAAPRERLAGTLAAVAHGVDAGAHVLRVHDVAAVADFLRVRAALRGELELAPPTRASRPTATPDPLA